MRGRVRGGCRRSVRSRVLPLALAGLGALAHRGAFAADGESSDGAGVALPLSPSLRSLIAGPLADGRPGVVMLFLPRGRFAARVAAPGRADVRRRGDAGRAWRSVPFEPDALGTAAAASRPLVVQAIVARPDGVSDQRSSGDWSSHGADSRRPPDRGGRGRRDVGAVRVVPSPSSTRDWWPARGWPSCTRICARRSMSRTRSSTSATPRTRRRSGGSPSRSGRSPTTARSTRCAATASRCAVAHVTVARAGSRPSCSTPGRCSRRMARIRCRSTRGSSS